MRVNPRFDANLRKNSALERLIMDLQRDGLVIRTRSQVVMSRLMSHAPEPR